MAYFLLSKKRVFEQFFKLSKIFDYISYSYKTNEVVGSLLLSSVYPEYRSKIVSIMSDALFSSNAKDFELDFLKPGDIKTIDEKLFLSVNSFRTFKKLKPFSNRIIYFLQGESEEEVKELLESIDWFVIDNVPELNKFIAVLNGLHNRKINLFLRMKFKEHTIYTGKYFVYGISWQELNSLLPKLRENKQINLLGIHFHRKTQNVGEWYLKEDFFDAISPRNLNLIDVVNIGGGLPWRYINSTPELGVIFNKLLEFKHELQRYNIRIMVEPGRFIAAPSVRLVARVLNAYENTLVVDASIFNAYMDTFLMNIRLPVLGEIRSKKSMVFSEVVSDQNQDVFSYLIKGNSPDSLDIFRYNVVFPRKYDVNDEIIFLDAGAYNFYTEFNDLPRIKTRLVEDFS